MIELKDQIGSLISLKNPPQRIVSLVPSQTEYLHDIGLGHSILGITKFCVHPNHLRKTKTIVGGTKNIHHDKIAQLQPDLIISNKEENNKEDILKLQENYPVYTSDIFTRDESFKMMEDLGVLCNKQAEARSLIANIQASFKNIAVAKGKTVAYVIWQKPFMLAGKKTYIQSMLTLAGFKNILSSEQSRYPETSLEELQKLNPDFIFLSSEPFPFKETHRNEIEKTTGIRTVLVDGEMFSWYGSRMLKFSEYLTNLKLSQ